MSKGLELISKIIVEGKDVSEIFGVLSEHPEAIDDSDQYGLTAAHFGALSSQKTLQALLDAGASLDGQDYKGNTPLHYAMYCRNGSDAKVEMLLKNGADPDISGEYGMTPLHCAVALGREDTVDTLLKLGANPRAYNSDGMRPLDMPMPGSRMDVMLRDATRNHDIGRAYEPKAAAAAMAM